MNIIEPLIELQDVDGQIRELEREMKDIPDRKAQESARLDGARLELAKAKALLVESQLSIKKSEAEAESARAKIHELRISQTSVKSNKEFTDINLKCDMLSQAAMAADNRGQAAMEEQPPLEENVKKAQDRLDEDGKGVNAFIAELDERLNAVTAEHAELMARRVELAKGVKPDVLQRYERLRTRRWPVVVLLTTDDVCDGCHMKQPPAVAQMVQHGDRIVGCSECGRILYRDI